MRKTHGFLIFSAAFAFAAAAEAQPGGPALVAVTPVLERELSEGRTFVGQVRPTRVSSVGSAVDGRVEEFFVNEGDRVEKGAELAKLRTRTLELERDAAKDEADALEAVLAELENGSLPEEKEQARATLAAAEANARYTKLRMDRLRNLFRIEGAAAQEEFQEATSLADQATQEVLRAKAAYELALQGPRSEQIKQAKARHLGQLANVERFDDRIKLHTIRAPFTGFVTVEHTEIGQWVKMGDLVVEMAELDEVDVEVQVIEDAIAGVRPGAEALVEVSALPGRPFTGVVTRIVPQADPRTRTFPVRVRVANEIEEGVPLLKSNMFARATLAVGRARSMILVPKDAIVLGGATPSVFVADDGDQGPVARPVPVRLGVASGGAIEVTGDLKPGQLVVVQGNERLRPGQALKITRQIEPASE